MLTLLIYILLSVTVTPCHGYTYQCTVDQCDGSPRRTASGYTYEPGAEDKECYIAVSRDLLARNGGLCEWGEWVLVIGPGPFGGFKRVEDTMAARHRRSIDVLSHRSGRARVWVVAISDRRK